MAQAIQLDRPPAQQTRTELTLTRVGEAWSYQPRGKDFAQALVDFLRAHSNPNTLRSYSYAVLEFFGWYERERGHIATPDMVRRADAVAFEQWLRERKEGLRAYYLANDPARKLDYAIFQICERYPGLHVHEIREQLMHDVRFTVLGPDGVRRLRVDERDAEGLEKRMACLIEVHTLRRTPSIAQIRRGDVDVGIPPGLARRVGIDVPVPSEVFRYYVPEQGKSAAERASTIASRLNALSSLWAFYMGTGENIGPQGPLLRVNVWVEPLKKAQRQAPSHQQTARALKTPGLSLFERLLATTFSRRFGEGSLQMAAAQMRPQIQEPLPRANKETFSDLRDRALMLLLGQIGVRSEELQLLRRRSMSGDPPMLTIVGKGGKVRTVRVPPATQRALEALERKIRRMADHQARYHPHRPQRHLELLQPDAPLLPPIAHWGANAGADDSKGLSRAGIAMMLRRRAIAAGISEGTADFARIHPHGLRHLFAKVSALGGAQLPVVQAIMGHASGAQTLKYMEEHAPEKLISAAFVPPPSPPPVERAPQAAPPSAPRPARPAPPPPRTPAARPASVPVQRVVSMLPTQFVDEPEPALIALGEEPEPDEEMVTFESDETVARLDRIYDERWGEREGHVRLGQAERPVAGELEELGVEAELAGVLGATEIVEAAGAGATALTHVYVGPDSGLPWWSGPNGRLRPEMPVMSPTQAGDCNEASQSAVCGSLIALWRKWMSGEGRGPTGAAALVQWLVQALEVSAQVAAELDARGGHWVPEDAPWDDTLDQGRPIMRLREHDPEAIVAWFEKFAWQFRRARTRGERPVDEPFDAPAYYAEADPLASLEHDERIELLDWIAALTGQQPQGRQVVYGDVDRAAIARFVTQMCFYDDQRDLVRELKVERRGGQASDVEVRAAEGAADRAAAQVDRTALTLGKSGFRIEEAVKERVAGRRGGAREKRRDFYMRIVGELFGPEAAADPVLRLVAQCGKTPLAGETFRDLFRVDWSAQTILPRRDYARAFAERTGTHAGCVARRVARDLWMVRERDRAGDRQRVLERPDELVKLVETMAAYRVPCPQEQEYELRSWLGARRPQPIYEAWAAQRQAEEITRRAHRRAEIDEDLLELEEAYGEEIADAFVGDIFAENPSRGREHRYTANAAMTLPTPLHLVSMALLR